jgi:multisubunit Na+/H+ antiporter MnhE subunit
MVLGAAFALGGVRSLLAVVPIALAHTLTMSLIRIGAFVLGIVAAMVSYGLITQRLMDHSHTPRWLQASSYVAALFCVAAGILVIRGMV